MEIRSPVDKYTIQECLSSKNDIRVYKCSSERLNSPVCLKIIAKKSFNKPERIKSQISILQSVKHPGIINYIESFEDNSCWVIVYDFFEGHTLNSTLQQQYRFSEEKARKVFKDIVDVIIYLHSNKIAHRNLSTENILINSFDEIKVIDFSCATSTFQEAESGFKEEPTVFDPPEVLIDKPAVAPLCDSWALGIILYFMVVGKAPFNGESRHEIYLSINSGGIMRPDVLPVAAHNLIIKLLEIDSLRRYSISMILNHFWISETVMNAKGQRPIMLSARRSVMTGHRESCINIRQKSQPIRCPVKTTRSFSQENTSEEENDKVLRLSLNSSATIGGSHALPKLNKRPAVVPE